MITSFKTYALLNELDANGDEQEIDVEVVVNSYYRGRAASFFEPPEDAELDFDVYADDGRCVNDEIQEDSKERIIELCFEHLDAR